MNLVITGKQIEIGDSLRDRVGRDLGVIVDKYFGSATDAHVVFSREGPFYRTHVTVHIAKGITAEGQSDHADIYESFNQAVEHTGKQLRRHKRKLRDHQ